MTRDEHWAGGAALFVAAETVPFLDLPAVPEWGLALLFGYLAGRQVCRAWIGGRP